MNRTEFITATTILLLTAFLLGWLASWVVGRLARPTRANMSELDLMAQQLHEAEEARDKAVAQLEESEARLMTQLRATEDELQTALDGLQESRKEIEELRDYIERKLARR